MEHVLPTSSYRLIPTKMTSKKSLSLSQRLRRANAGYAGDVQVIIGGHRHNIDSALDYGETRIIDAEVVAVFPKVR